MSAPDTSGWGEPELRSEIHRLRLREAKAKKKYDQAREEASEKEDEVGRLMEKLQDVMVSLDQSREECEELRQQGLGETFAGVNSASAEDADELAAVKSTLADRDAELAKAENAAELRGFAQRYGVVINTIVETPLISPRPPPAASE